MNLQKIILVILILGIILFTYSFTLQPYKNQETANNIIDKYPEMNEDIYYQQISEQRTNKIKFMDLGSGLVIVSSIILFFLFTYKIRLFDDLNKIYSFKITNIFVITNIIWLLQIPGTFWYYTFRLERGDYHTLADSIGIPISESIPFLLLMLIPINLFILLTSLNSKFPTKIFIKTEKYNLKGILIEIFFGIFILLNIFLMIGSVIDGDHFMIIFDLFFLYFLINLRAGNIYKFNDKLPLLKI